MNPRPFVLTSDHQKKLMKLAEYAADNPYSMDDMLDLINNKGRIAGDNHNFKLFVPVGYCIVFSIEQQLDGPTRHLSMSVDEDECLPALPVVEMVMRFLGYQSNIKECYVKLESIEPINDGGQRDAVNVWEIIK